MHYSSFLITSCLLHWSYQGVVRAVLNQKCVVDRTGPISMAARREWNINHTKLKQPSQLQNSHGVFFKGEKKILSLKGARTTERDNRKTSDSVSFSCPYAMLLLLCPAQRKVRAEGSALLDKRSSISRPTHSPCLDLPSGWNRAVSVKSAQQHLVCTGSESHHQDSSDGRGTSARLPAGWQTGSRASPVLRLAQWCQTQALFSC